MKKGILLFALALIAVLVMGCATPTATTAPEATEAVTDAATEAATEAPAEVKELKIVSSLPMTGASLTQTQTIVNAMQLRLEQDGGEACDGTVKLTYEAWDDASAALGK